MGVWEGGSESGEDGKEREEKKGRMERGHLLDVAVELLRDYPNDITILAGSSSRGRQQWSPGEL